MIVSAGSHIRTPARAHTFLDTYILLVTPLSTLKETETRFRFGCELAEWCH